MRVAVLIPPNAVPGLDERQEVFQARGRLISDLVSLGIRVIGQAGDVFDQFVDGWRRLCVWEVFGDLVVAAKPARLFADEYGARGDRLGQRGDAIERITVSRAPRSNVVRVLVREGPARAG